MLFTPLLRRIGLTIEPDPLRRLLADAGFTHARDIKTYTSMEERLALARLAGSVEGGGRIVELGAYLGASTCCVLAGSYESEAEVVAIDTWQNDAMSEGHRDTYAEFCRNTAPGSNRLRPIRKRVAEVDAEEVGPAGLIFIDGDHSYDGTTIDFRFAREVCREGGVIAFHDVNSRKHHGPARVIGEALATGDWVPVGLVHSLVWIRRRPQ